MFLYLSILLIREYTSSVPRKKKKLADKILPQKVRDLVPESQAYMDLLAFERKLDSTIMRKRLDIQVLLSGFRVRMITEIYIFFLGSPQAPNEAKEKTKDFHFKYVLSCQRE